MNSSIIEVTLTTMCQRIADLEQTIAEKDKRIYELECGLNQSRSRQHYLEEDIAALNKEQPK